MTSVAEEQSLQLTCFLRLYCGRYQPLTGGELLLEPIAWPHDQEGPTLPTSSPTPAVNLHTVETQTEDVEDPKRRPRRSGGKGDTRQRSWRSHDMVGAAGAIFPKEIELTGTEVGYDAYSSPIEVIEDPDPPDPPAVPPVPASSSALPLVSQLVKELMQM